MPGSSAQEDIRDVAERLTSCRKGLHLRPIAAARFDSSWPCRIVRSGFKPTFLVAIWRGGAPIGIAVQEALEYHGIHVDHIAIRTSSYTGIDQQSKVVRVHALNYLISRLSFEDELLIIDDVFDSGRSLEAVVAELRPPAAGAILADKIRIATVYYKP